jgi:hypothetical protein
LHAGRNHHPDPVNFHNHRLSRNRREKDDCGPIACKAAPIKVPELSLVMASNARYKICLHFRGFGRRFRLDIVPGGVSKRRSLSCEGGNRA